MADINVMVVVNTNNITQDDLTKNVVLVDSKNDADINCGNSSTFQINAVKGNKIKFNICAVDGETKVAFTAIQNENSKAFSTEPTYSKWVGIVKESGNFSISFNVDGNIGNPFTLDPELQVKN